MPVEVIDIEPGLKNGGYESLGLKDLGVDENLYKKIWDENHTQTSEVGLNIRFKEGEAYKWKSDILDYESLKDLFDNNFLKSKLFGVKKIIDDKIFFFVNFPSFFFKKPPKVNYNFFLSPSIYGFSSQFFLETNDENGEILRRIVEFNFSELLNLEKFSVVFCKNNKPEIAINYSTYYDDKEHKENDVKNYNSLRDNYPLLNKNLHTLMILDNPALDAYLSKEDRLKVGWATNHRSFYKTCHLVRKSISEVNRIDTYFSKLASITEDEEVKKGYQTAKDILKSCVEVKNTTDIPNVIHKIFNDLDKRKYFMSIFYGSAAVGSRVIQQIRFFFNYYMFSEIYSDYGMKMPCLDMTEPNNIETFLIDYENLPENKNGLDKYLYYWKLFFNAVNGSQVCNGDMATILEPFDVPIAAEEYKDIFNNIDISDTEENVEKLCISLLEEANASKNWVLNNGSYFAIDLGEFKAVQLSEKFEDIHAKFITKDNFYYFMNVNFELLMTNHDVVINEVLGEIKARRVILALKQIVCALVRDYWVVEKKETVFEQKKISDYLPRKYNQEKKPFRVVYLPRVKYEKKSSGIKECYENLNFKTRSKHAVRAFMRVSKNISPLQKFLAARYNFEVPEGHTFVQPHYRGETTEQKIIYRSRSAMQMIFNKEVGSSVKTNNYFQFEVDVKNLFKKNKYDVKHYSANKRNDGGIDVVATKNLKDKQIIYLIQCKCYKKIKIGPDIVRELAGSMIGYGDECKGIVITTSKFTQDAELERKKLAQQNIDISFIDGEKFVNLIRSK
jgi:hypothetical protein